MYKNLSLVYDRLMDVDYESYKNIISEEIGSVETSKILDLGCGSGALTPYLAKYGKVYAVDKSEEMLAIASSKTSEANYFALDLLDIKVLNENFDFILSAFDVLNYLDSFEDFSKAIKNIYDILNKGGKFVFDIHTPSKINFMLEKEVFAYDEEDISYVWYTYPTDNPLEVESEISFFVKEDNDLYKKIYEYQKQRTYDINKIITLIEETGFTINKYFCDFDKENKDFENSHRIIFVVSK